MKLPWIKHPRSGDPDTMLTMALGAFLVCLGKFLVNGVILTFGDKSINLGVIDAGLIAALLTPTLGAYVMRKYSSSPDKKGEEDGK